MRERREQGHRKEEGVRAVWAAQIACMGSEGSVSGIGGGARCDDHSSGLSSAAWVAWSCLILFGCES